ncbi:Alpha/Beta hydrolase protein [Jimgerdemannia flammicorona]|uniref:Alpha/Beta hydrolase protein n=1 Tax=Jimgerdemannia flammicorona TaxID=994334 RepID=A0A433QEU7_9FUNG|nr:Alpha/Beta hydrolase protein [Jimgerdemannia flammicorona]
MSNSPSPRPLAIVTCYPVIATMSDPSQITLPLGQLRGAVRPTHRVFYNIPYAQFPTGRPALTHSQAPIGELRWRAPKKLEQKWEEVRDATKPGPKCPQPGGFQTPDVIFDDPKTVSDEDNCLNLNVWTPPVQTQPKEGWPVMVYVFGGGFRNGNGGAPAYDGSNFVGSNPIILVTINYRVNIFGFLASRELAEDSGDGSAGNYGFLDQRLAFEWVSPRTYCEVKGNIHLFGGDVSRITAFGNSAGSLMILLHLFISRNLFHRAILQSGIKLTTPTPKISDQQRTFDLVCDELGIKSPNRLDQLRRVPSNKLTEIIPRIEMNANTKIRWHGTMDGVTVHKEIRTLLNEGGVDPNVLEIVVGNTTDEGTLFVTGIPIAETYHDTLAKIFPTIAGKVEALYPITEFRDTQMIALARIHGDRAFSGPVRHAARHLAATGRKVYYYRFNSLLEITSELNLGIHHAIELPFLFKRSEQLTEAENRTSDRVIEAWTSFAASGVPLLGKASVEWEQFTGKGGKVLVFEEGGVTRYETDDSKVSDQRLTFWDAFEDQA